MDPWLDGCDTDAPEFRTLGVGELELHVACRGSGPTVLLLRGFREFWDGWEKVMAHLSDRFRVIAPDQRGYNPSDKPAAVSDYEYPHMVDDIAGLIDAVGGPVTLVGHDWGGGVAWPAASTLVMWGMDDTALLPLNLEGLDPWSMIHQPLPSPTGLCFAMALSLLVAYPSTLPRGSSPSPTTASRRTRSGVANQAPWVADLTTVQVPGAGHFVEHDAHERVAELIGDFAAD